MVKYIFKRIGAGIVSLFVLITITFFLLHIIPGGPFSPAENRNVPPQILEKITEQYGLNDPIPEQYVRYLKNLAQGNLGTSFKKQDTTVNELIAQGFPVSAKVGLWGVLISLAIGVPLGVVAAVKRGKWPDGAAMVFATIGVSVPSFVICVLMMYFFCEKVEDFPILWIDFLETLYLTGILYGIFPDCLHYETDAFFHAGNHASGLYPDRAGKRRAGICCNWQVCHEKFPAAHYYLCRPYGSGPFNRYVYYRKDVFRTWPGKIFRNGHQRQRLFGNPGSDFVCRSVNYRCQHHCRHYVCPD